MIKQKRMTKQIQLKVHQKGSGKDILLIPGITSTYRYWNGVAEIIGDDYRLIIPDVLGFGSSPKPLSSSYSIEEHARYVEEALDRLGIKQPIQIVGHSFGALVALHIATQSPHRVSKLVLSALPMMEKRSGAAAIAKVADMPKWMVEGRGPYIFATIIMIFRYFFSWSLPVFFKKWPRHVVADFTKLTPWSFARTAYAQIQVNLKGYFDKLHVPTTILIAKDDPLTKHAGKYVKLLSNNSEVRIIEVDGDHQIPLNHPQLIADTIIGK